MRLKALRGKKGGKKGFVDPRMNFLDECDDAETDPSSMAVPVILQNNFSEHNYN